MIWLQAIGESKFCQLSRFGHLCCANGAMCSWRLPLERFGSWVV